MPKVHTVLIRRKGSDSIYETDIEGNATNLTTNKRGKIEKGTNNYTIPLTLNDMHQRNEYLSKLINQLGLAIEL